MLTLGIDTSCDDTSLAILDDEKILASLSANQDQFHARYGGVVPEISARKHLESFLPLFKLLLHDAGITPAGIDLVAATYGPGLIGGLLVGAVFANIFSGSLGKPGIGIHHLEGHLYSPALDAEPLPGKHIGLVISGGHTRLFAVEKRFAYRELGATRDDAAGELIDKTGRLLGFPYPGGKVMDETAMAYDGEPVEFPRPMISSDDYDFSFSGLKTAVLYHLRDNPGSSIDVGAIARGIMAAMADVLISKSFRACREMGYDTIAVAGGVSASRYLRRAFAEAGGKEDIDIRFPQPAYTTDNAAMIASAGYARFKAGLIPDEPIDCKASAMLV